LCQGVVSNPGQLTAAPLTAPEAVVAVPNIPRQFWCGTTVATAAFVITSGRSMPPT
jgi:hypothetical protein